MSDARRESLARSSAAAERARAIVEQRLGRSRPRDDRPSLDGQRHTHQGRAVSDGRVSPCLADHPSLSSTFCDRPAEHEDEHRCQFRGGDQVVWPKTPSVRAAAFPLDAGRSTSPEQERCATCRREGEKPITHVGRLHARIGELEAQVRALTAPAQSDPDPQVTENARPSS